MNSLPNDLIHEIFSRLPPKSVGRSRCASKLWCSMLCSKNFTDLFRTRSSARPRLLFVCEQNFGSDFFSSAQPQNPYEKSSLVVATDFHMRFSDDNCKYASGLIYVGNNIEDAAAGAICNPSTGQYEFLPLPEGVELRTYKGLKSYLGFDPIEKKFKVLLMSIKRGDIASNETVHHIATLGTGKTIRWRIIQCPFSHALFQERICINGVLYYKAGNPYKKCTVVVCFDVRSETFKFVDAEFCGYRQDEFYYSFINYKGKLCMIRIDYSGESGALLPLKLRMWVLENVEKQEWSERFYTLRDENGVVSGGSVVSVAPEMTATGEIVLYMGIYKSKEPYYVFYFNPERKTLHSVEIQGFEQELFDVSHSVYAFVHLEDLNFNIMKTTKTSISPREQKPKPTITSISPREQKPKPIITSASSISPQEQKPKPTVTSASSRQDHQVRTIAHMQQDHM